MSFKNKIGSERMITESGVMESDKKVTKGFRDTIDEELADISSEDEAKSYLTTDVEAHKLQQVHSDTLCKKVITKKSNFSEGVKNNQEITKLKNILVRVFNMEKLTQINPLNARNKNHTKFEVQIPTPQQESALINELNKCIGEEFKFFTRHSMAEKYLQQDDRKLKSFILDSTVTSFDNFKLYMQLHHELIELETLVKKIAIKMKKKRYLLSSSNFSNKDSLSDYNKALYMNKKNYYKIIEMMKSVSHTQFLLDFSKTHNVELPFNSEPYEECSHDFLPPIPKETNDNTKSITIVDNNNNACKQKKSRTLNIENIFEDKDKKESIGNSILRKRSNIEGLEMLNFVNLKLGKKAQKVSNGSLGAKNEMITLISVPGAMEWQEFNSCNRSKMSLFSKYIGSTGNYIHKQMGNEDSNYNEEYFVKEKENGDEGIYQEDNESKLNICDSLLNVKNWF